MITIPFLQDLYRHLEWAESVIWVTALDSPKTKGDAELKEKLHHIHNTQWAFLEIWTNRYPDHGRTKREFASLAEVQAWAYPYYSQVRAHLEALRPEELTAPMPVPWGRELARHLGREAGSTTLGETLYQVVAHSSYHRAQVNHRLRTLGVEPPLVDYIAWLWLGRPKPEWSRIPSRESRLR